MSVRPRPADWLGRVAGRRDQAQVARRTPVERLRIAVAWAMRAVLATSLPAKSRRMMQAGLATLQVQARAKAGPP